jgi:hypothetical protein
MGIAVAAVPQGQCPDECATPTMPPTATSTPTATRTPVSTATASATAPMIPCPGDCNADGAVTVNELVAAVAIALAQESVAACEAADADGDRTVTVAELVGAVDRLLAGCAGYKEVC